ncbi:MAG TPA: YncE family protein [Usitatibacter sp.]|nr:YncE family protein [Usitatibacter sp.]
MPPRRILRRTAVLAACALAAPAWAQSVTHTLATGDGPRSIAVDAAARRVYVANEFSNSVTAINADTLASVSVAAGNRPQYVAVNPRTHKVFASNGDSSQTVIDPATLATTMLPTGGNGPMVVSPSTNIVYLIRLGPADEVTRIDASANTWYSMSTESYSPVGEALDDAAQKLYVVNYATGDVRTVDLTSTSDHPPTKTVAVWGHPTALALNPLTRKIYVVGEDSRGPINVIDVATNTATYFAPAGHAAMGKAVAVNTRTNKAYAAFQGEVVVIDGATNAMTFIPSGSASSAGPVAIAVDENANKVYVANAQGFVTVIDGATNAAKNVAVSGSPNAIALDPTTGRVFVASDVISVIDPSGASTPPPPPLRPAAIDVQGLWWGGAPESGWGINLTHQGDTLFATWFTYDASGKGQWLVMSNGARVGDQSYSGTLYRTTGSAFNGPYDPSRLVVTPVGTASFSFADPDHGTFSATVDGATVNKAIVREVFASPVPACTLGGAPGPLPNYQDLWWRSGGTESGWGINLTHQGDIIFLTWFTYDADGTGMWLVGPRLQRTGNGTYSGDLYRTAGPPFNSQPWNSSSVSAMPAGRASLSFSDASNATFTATFALGLTVTKAISREGFASPASVCR